MQNETSLYDIPADQLLLAHERLGEGTEIGEARVVSTLFGKARIRIVHKKDRSGWLWLLAASVVLGIIAAIWLNQAAPPPPETDSVAGSPAQINPQIPPEQQNAVPLIPPPAADTSIAAQPAIQPPLPAEPIKPDPAKKPSIAEKPKTPPVATSDDQPEQSEEMGQTDESPTPVPVQAKPAATQPAIQITKTPNAPDKPATESAVKTPPPAANTRQPNQSGVQP